MGGAVIPHSPERADGSGKASPDEGRGKGYHLIRKLGARALAAGSALAAVALSFLPPFGRGYPAVTDIFFLLSVKMILQGDSTGAQKALKKGMAPKLRPF